MGLQIHEVPEVERPALGASSMLWAYQHMEQAGMGPRELADNKSRWVVKSED